MVVYSAVPPQRVFRGTEFWICTAVLFFVRGAGYPFSGDTQPQRRRSPQGVQVTVNIPVCVWVYGVYVTSRIREAGTTGRCPASNPLCVTFYSGADALVEDFNLLQTFFLANSPFICGDFPSIADISVVTPMMFLVCFLVHWNTRR